MATNGLILAAGVTVATMIVVGVAFLVARLTLHSERSRAVLRRTHRPAQLLGAALALQVSLPPAIDERWRGPVAQAATVVLVAATAWLIGVLVVAIESIVVLRYRVDVQDNLAARRLRTQISVVRRVSIAVITVLAVGAVLMTFPAARAAGASVLASAGLVGVVAALAAQSTLGNLFAGLQLAFGDALRLDDVVVGEDEWGRVEDLTLSYVVVRIWDERRLILPTSYFTSKPFENWTRRGSSVLGTVEVDVDWTLPIEDVRAEGRRIVEDSPLWDARTYALQVTNAIGGAIRIRILVSAADSATLWELRCLVRERVVSWLRKNHPYALPKTRAALDDGSPVHVQ